MINQLLAGKLSRQVGLCLPAIIAAALLAMTFSPAVFAQSQEDEASDLSLEEVVVTARKREESLMEVPVAVSAFSGELLAEVDVSDITYIERLSPNTTLTQSRATSSTLTAFIRGVGQQDPLVGFEPGVGIYLDDVYIARPQGAIFQVYDVQSIEVLRGPQGTLYGRNTIGGALKYITRRLPDFAEGKIELAAGVDGHGQLDGIFTGSTPVSETVRIGGSIASFNRDGYGKNLFSGEDHYDQKILAGRLSLEWLPTENFFLRVAADYTDDETGAKGGHRLTPAPGYPILDNVHDHRSGATTSPSTAGINGNNETETKGVSLLMEWYLNDEITLKSITAYREGYTENVIDFDSLPEMIFDAPVLYQDDQFSQELQLIYSGERWQGVVGLHYLDAWASNDFDIVFGLFGITQYSFGETDTSAWAVFADFSYEISEQWSFSLGGRYTDDKREADILRETWLGIGSPYFGNADAIFAGSTGDYVGSRNDSDFTPRVSLSWRPNQDHHVYLTYAEGFKAGSFDPRGNNFLFPDVVEGYAPEYVDSWELGWKSTWAGGRGTTSIALFTNDYTDQQIPGSVLVDTDGDGVDDDFFGTVTNAGKSTMDGFEFEGTFLVTDNFLLRGVVGYIDAEIKEWIVEGENIADEVSFQNTPEWTAAVSFDWRWDLNLGSWEGDMGLIGTWAYRDDVQQFEFPSPIDQPAYSLFDLSWIWASDDGRYLFGLHGKNLTDEEYRVAGYNFPTLNVVTGFYGAPRTITATAQFLFN